MKKPRSLDLKETAIHMMFSLSNTVEKVSTCLKVSMPTLFRWRAQYKRGELTAPRKPGPSKGQGCAISNAAVLKSVEDKPHLTIAERAKTFNVCYDTMFNSLHRAGITLKKTHHVTSK